MANKFKVDLANLFTNWNDDVGEWATSSGGVVIASHPVTGDAAILDGGSGNVVVNVSSACSSLSATAAYARTMSGSAALDLTGTGTIWSWAAGTLTYSGTITISNVSASAKTFAGGGKTYGALTIAAGDGNVTITGANTFAAITAGGTFPTLILSESQTVTAGLSFTDDQELDIASGKTLTCASLSTVGAVVFEDAHIVLTGTGTVWSFSPSASPVYTNTSTITIANTGGTGKTISGGNKFIPNLTITGSSGAVTFSGDNKIDGAFVSGATPLVTSGTLTFAEEFITSTVTLTGCPSITGGTWSKASGTVTAPAGCLITGNTAQGGATFDGSAAYDGGGNSGWAGLQPLPTAGSSAILNILLSDEE